MANSDGWDQGTSGATRELSQKMSSSSRKRVGSASYSPIRVLLGRRSTSLANRNSAPLESRVINVDYEAEYKEGTTPLHSLASPGNNAHNSASHSIVGPRPADEQLEVHRKFL